MLTGVATLVADGSAPAVTWTMVVNFLVGVGLPILVALVTKEVTNPRTKAIILLLLSTVSGVLNEWLVSTGDFQWPKAIYNAVVMFVIGIATLYGLWRPTGVSGKAQQTLVK